MRARLIRFLRATGGASAVEFALVLPVFAAVMISLPDISQAAIGALDMEAAARASVQYAMAGGSSMATAQSVGLQSWTGKPANGAISASEACQCNGGAGTCGQNCPDGSAPQVYFTVTASGLLGGSMIHFQKSVSRTVRVQ